MKKIFLALLLTTSSSFAAEREFRKCPSLKEMGNLIYQDLKQTRPQVKVSKTVKIAVIDTGIDFRNKELRARIWTPEGKVNENNFGLNFIENNEAPQDTHGHGTHVSGIILSLFPEAKIFPIKYYSPVISGQKNLENMMKGLKAAIKAKVDIINISAGGPEASSEELELIKEAKRNNILVISAAGNEGYELSKEKTYYPAQYAEDNILSVLNLDKLGMRQPSSNYGKEIEVGTLGTIYSYGLGSCSQRMTGTSQATAVVSALAAMIKAENPELTYKEIKKIILESTEDSPSSYKSISFTKFSNTTKLAKVKMLPKNPETDNIIAKFINLLK